MDTKGESRKMGSMNLGFDVSRLERVGAAIRTDIEEEKCDGAALFVARRGEPVLREAWGFADRSAGRELTIEDPFFTMSLGKQFTVTTVLNRVERGQLSLRMRVAEVIPEFAKAGKERVTLAQLLTHTGGIVSMLPTMPPADLSNLEEFVAAVCESAAEARPGDRVHYSVFAAHSVMAEMVRRVDGGSRPFRDIIREDLFEPLGMKDTALGLRSDLAERMCPVVARYEGTGLFDPRMAEAFPSMVGEKGEVPAGGFLSTADDVHRFAEMLRRGGELNGQRILSPAMIELATRNYTGARRNEVFDCILEMRGWDPWPAYLGLGFFVRGEEVIPGPFGNLNSPRTFGGFGAGSTCFWVDPERDLTLVMLTSGLMEDSRHLERNQRVSDLVLAALVD
jgi:CubicO group peptidase (beta-lactamase class C family)